MKKYRVFVTRTEEGKTPELITEFRLPAISLKDGWKWIFEYWFDNEHGKDIKKLGQFNEDKDVFSWHDQFNRVTTMEIFNDE